MNSTHRKDKQDHGCDMCGQQMKKGPEYFFKLSYLLDNYGFWELKYSTMEKQNIAIPASLKSVLELVNRTISRGYGFRVCSNCALIIQPDCSPDLEQSEQWDTDPKLTRAFSFNEVESAKYILTVNDKQFFHEIYGMALSVLADYLLCKWNSIQSLEVPISDRDRKLIEVNKTLAGIDLIIRPDPKTGKQEWAHHLGDATFTRSFIFGDSSDRYQNNQFAKTIISDQ